MVPSEILRRADTVVLLAGFAAFVPLGRGRRHIRAALSDMAAGLGDEARARTMLASFLTKVAEPQSPEALPPGPDGGAPRSLPRRDRLSEILP
jgi:pimeloyl-[acyl-carrier protein] methyl ester esterase